MTVKYKAHDYQTYGFIKCTRLLDSNFELRIPINIYFKNYTFQYRILDLCRIKVL